MRHGAPLFPAAVVAVAAATASRCRLDPVEAVAAFCVPSAPPRPLSFSPTALSGAFRGPKRSSSSDRRSDADEYGSGDGDAYSYPASDFADDESVDERSVRSASPPTDAGTTTTSAGFAVDPLSADARARTAALGMTPDQHESLGVLAELVVEWNERINLVSRKDCTVPVVFGRHVLPSVSLCTVPDFPLGRPDDEEQRGEGGRRAVDVGTGGGFPGLPLAIAYPDVSFLLVDSVRKKLTAVQAMADELGLTNVKTLHSRVEEMTDEPAGRQEHARAYELCLGRSVTALPRFCFWVQDLLRRRKDGDDEEEDEGALVYIIGGDVEESVTSRVMHDVPLSSLLGDPGSSDKRALVVSASDLADIAAESGEVRKKMSPPGSGKKNKRSNPRRTRKEAKGKWKDRDADDKPKQRGYENFKRYQS